LTSTVSISILRLPPQVGISHSWLKITLTVVDSAAGYIQMIKTLRSLFLTNPCKKYVITGAPQCALPDTIMGNMIQEAEFDALWIQFYNTPGCSARAWVAQNSAMNSTHPEQARPGSFTYDTWVSTTSRGASANAKLYLGLLGAPGGSNSYPGDFLWPEEAQNLIDTYASHTRFGGVMLWDATWANGQEVSYKGYSGNYHNYIKSVLSPFAPRFTITAHPLCPTTTSSTTCTSTT
jgi:chitinase